MWPTSYLVCRIRQFVQEVQFTTILLMFQRQLFEGNYNIQKLRTYEK